MMFLLYIEHFVVVIDRVKMVENGKKACNGSVSAVEVLWILLFDINRIPVIFQYPFLYFLLLRDTAGQQIRAV